MKLFAQRILVGCGIFLATVLSADAAPPVNDAFTNRIALSGPSVSVAGSNVGATKEPGEPYHWFLQGTNSIWWTWTATASAPVTINTFGSGLDTVLAVYTGNVVSSLTLVKRNDDAGGGTNSQVTFNAATGTVYQIAVAGYGFGSSVGSVVLNLHVSNAPPSVTIVTPLDGSSVSTGAVITISALASDFNYNSISVVEFYDGVTKIGQDTTRPYSFAWSGAMLGDHLLTAVATNTAGLRGTSSVVTVTVASTNNIIVTNFTTLSPFGSVWKYRDDGSDQGTAWRSNSFDDAGWASGPAQLGYGDGDEATVVNSGVVSNYFITTYFRQAIVLTNVSAYTNLYVQLKRDDGAVVYLNGTELVRDNMPAGTVGYLTTASSTASDDGNTTFEFSVSTGSLVNGTNLLAVEIHQASSISTDISFDLELVGASVSVLKQPPSASLTQPTNGALFSLALTSNLTLNATATGAGSVITNVEFYAGAVFLGDDASVPYSVSWSNLTAGTFALRAVAVDAFGTRGTSAPVNVTLVNNFAPTVSITNPPGGSSFSVFTNVAVGTAPADADGTISKVEFYQGVTKIGEATNAPFTFVWSNFLVGVYTLTAVATDNADATGTSGPVNISINNNIVVITSPTNGAGFTIPVSVPISVTTSDENGAIWRVEFFHDGIKLGEVANAPYNFTWTNTPVGIFSLTAVSTDVNSLLNTSAPVVISVAANVLPAISITSPTNNASFLLPASISITVAASDSDGSVTNVEFFDGSTKIGQNNVSPFSFTYNNPPAGSRSLRAVVTDNNGATNTSAAVVINVLPATLTRGPYLQMGTTNTAIIRWCSSVETDGFVRYGDHPTNLLFTATESIFKTNHLVRLTNLQPDTKYYYAVGASNTVIAAQTNFFLVTPPPIGTPKPTRMWILGDAGTANGNQANVRNAYNTYAATNGRSDLILMLGDNAYNSGSDAEYQAAVFGMYTNNLCNTFTYSCIGNHETAQVANPASITMLDWFSFPKNGEVGGVASGTDRYYSFDHGNIHFVVLDSMTSSRAGGDPMLTWLANDLAATAQPWIIAFWHHPPYTKGSHNSDSEANCVDMRANANPILEAYGVDLVLTGHSHCYERSYLINGHYGISSTLTPAMKIDTGSGTTTDTGAYLKVGTAGAIYTVAGSAGQVSGGALNHTAMFKSLNILGSMVIEITSNRLDAVFLNTNTVVLDRFTIIKGHQTQVPAAPSGLVASYLTSTQVRLVWGNNATNETGYKIENSTNGINFTQIATLGANYTNYTNSGLSAGLNYYWRIRATNSAGDSDYSNIASVGPVLQIAVHPQSRTNLAGSMASLFVVAGGDATIFYQWIKDGDDLTGETNSILTLPNVQVADAGGYWVQVTNASGSLLSDTATLTVTQAVVIAPGISQSPASVTVTNGQNAVFTVIATGTSPQYQWQRGGVNLGANNATLAVNNVQPPDAGSYRVIVTNAAGSVTSAPAVLSVVVTNQPVLSALILTNNYFQVTLSGLVGGKYALDRSFDLLNWTQWVVFTNQSVQTPLLDTNAPAVNTRYYRGRALLLP